MNISFFYTSIFITNLQSFLDLLGFEYDLQLFYVFLYKYDHQCSYNLLYKHKQMFVWGKDYKIGCKSIWNHAIEDETKLP